jgi:hypothetical protein
MLQLPHDGENLQDKAKKRANENIISMSHSRVGQGGST